MVVADLKYQILESFEDNAAEEAVVPYRPNGPLTQISVIMTQNPGMVIISQILSLSCHLEFLNSGPTRRPRRAGAPPPRPPLNRRRRRLPGAVQPHRPHQLTACARGRRRRRVVVVVVGAGAGQPGVPPPAARGRGGAPRSRQGEASSTAFMAYLEMCLLPHSDKMSFSQEHAIKACWNYLDQG